MLPRLPGHGAIPRIHDTATGQLVEAHPLAVAGLYVCGITHYDATHIGHAATYLAYDTLIRLWLDAGYSVRYVQNTTDVDDPLLERAAATGDDWEWTDALLAEAQERLESWSDWAARGRSTGTTSILDGMRAALVHDLDTPTALAAVDARAARGSAPTEGISPRSTHSSASASDSRAREARH